MIRKTVMRVAATVAVTAPIVLVGAQAADASWALQNPPVPAGAIGSSLDDVGCTTGNACVAIGTSELSGSVFVAFADSWNGSAWTLESIPNAANSNLSGVSCPVIGGCVAVGDVLKNGVLVPLAEQASGSAWTAMYPPAPSGATSSYLISDYCAGGHKCTAVGFYRDSSGNQLTFADTLTGSTWTLHATPDPSGATTNELSKVYCTSATSCVAAGYYLSPSYTLLAESWNGTNWSIMTTPLPTGGTYGLFQGVSCRAANACFAVGSYNNGTQLLALSEFWNGTSWTPQATAPLATAKAAGLAGVSCTTFGPCTAVGYERKHAHNLTLAEYWNGTSWKFQNTVTPPGATNSSLSAVSCRSKIDCTAVGFYTNSTGDDLVMAEQNT